MAHSALKNSPMGLMGSYDAALAYEQEAKQLRDELLAKYSNNKKEEKEEE
jgi:hypothetical protein